MLKIPEKIQFIINTLTQNGYEAYIVGGCVRDALLGNTPSDYDITTSAKPEKIIGLFEKTVPTGIQHGTVTVITEGEPVEVTTFRTESGYLDSRHPQSVEFVTDLKEDLSRRDFTVNALAYNENTGVVDYYEGLADLKSKVLRAVGEPKKRFSEDALRILRLFRFASQLEFSIEENTLKSALLLQDGLKSISRERIFSELKRTVSGKNPKALLPLINSGGLEFLRITTAPELYTKTDNCDLRLFSLLNASSDPIATLKELKASKREIEFCEELLRLSALPFETDEDIKNAMFLTDPKTVLAYFEYLGKDYSSITEILQRGEPYSVSQLAVGGEDLKALGFSGKEIGQRLELLRQTVVKDPEKNKKDLLLSLTK